MYSTWGTCKGCRYNFQLNAEGWCGCCERNRPAILAHRLTEGEFCTRDPVHGWIRLPAFIKPVLNHPLFQRLYRISQVTSVELVYTGANHTRGAHSLGAAYIAMAYCKHLFPDDPDVTRAVCVAALLHDVGHGPFSHSWDSTVYSKIYDPADGEGMKKHGHDQHRFALVRHMAPLIDKIIPHERVLDIWRQATPQDTVLNLIVQGPFGGDRMDFVQRDALHSGTQHFGAVAWKRLVDNSSIRGDLLCFRYKVLADMVHAIRARLHMYREVYLHRTAVAGTLLLERAIMEMTDEMNFVERTKDLEQFTLLNDSILTEMALRGNNYALRYLHRKLPTLVWEHVGELHTPPEAEKNQVIKISKVRGYSEERLDNMIHIVDGDEILDFSEALEKFHHGSLDMKTTISRLYQL